MRPPPDHYYHAVPLHRAPYLLHTGALYSHDALRKNALPIGPRPTAARRDRKLKLAGYVHLALEPITPLLRDKLKKGYPHALLEFDARIARFDSSAYLRFNPKAWRHREDFAPVIRAEEKTVFLEEWRQGNYPSAELLIPETLPLAGNLLRIYLGSERECAWLGEWQEAREPDSRFPLTVEPAILPPCASFDWSPFWEYAAQCRLANTTLPPPDLPFD